MKKSQLILLEADRALSLEALAERFGVPKQVLLREAVEDLLLKYGAAAGVRTMRYHSESQNGQSERHA